MRAFIEQSKFWHPRLPTIILCFFKNDFVFEETPEDEKLKIWNYVWMRHLKNPSRQRVQYKKWGEIIRTLHNEGKRLVRRKNTMSNRELALSFLRFNEAVRDHWRMTWVQESADIFTTYELPKLMRQEFPGLTDERLNNIAFTLSSPLKLSFIQQARGGVLTIMLKWYAALRKYNNYPRLPERFRNQLEAFARGHSWLRSNYRESRALGAQDFWEEMRLEVKNNTRAKLVRGLRDIRAKIARTKKEQARLRLALPCSLKLKRAFELLSFWSGWVDERKRIALIADRYFEEYAREISRRLRMNVREVKYMTIEEVQTALMRGVIPRRPQLRKRRTLSCYVAWKRGKGEREAMLTGRDARQLWKTMFPAQKTAAIQGQVASSLPVKSFQGRVQVVLDVSNARFKAGAILVTTMTRPEFVPLMHKASAVITDEGGLTSHAAIVSRELGIPCIIGTRIATKVLKTGDRVEIDAVKGMVRKI